MAERGALLDMALDDIIKTNENQRPSRGRGRGGRGSFRGNQRRQAPTAGGAIRRDRPVQRRAFVAPYQKRDGNADGFWQHDRFDEEEEDFEEAPQRGVSSSLRSRIGTGAVAAGPTKVQVSNLEHTVSQEDLEELFSSVGELQRVHLKFDRSGRSNGIADVYFIKKADAVKAVKEYNGVSIDGKPMALALGAAIPTAPIGGGAVFTPRERVERVERVVERPTVRVSMSGRPQQQSRSAFVPRGTRGGRGGSFRGGRGGFRNRNNQDEDISASALDAELDAYMEQN